MEQCVGPECVRRRRFFDNFSLLGIPVVRTLDFAVDLLMFSSAFCIKSFYSTF